MLSLSLPGRVFLCTLPTDMRKSFDSLAGLVEQELGQDPLAGRNQGAGHVPAAHLPCRARHCRPTAAAARQVDNGKR